MTYSGAVLVMHRLAPIARDGARPITIAYYGASLAVMLDAARALKRAYRGAIWIERAGQPATRPRS